MILVLCLLMALGACAEQPATTQATEDLQSKEAPKTWEPPASTETTTSATPSEDTGDWIIPTAPDAGASGTTNATPETWGPPQTSPEAAQSESSQKPGSWQPPESGAGVDIQPAPGTPDLWQPPESDQSVQPQSSGQNVQPWTITRPQDAQTGAAKPADAWAAPQTTGQSQTGIRTQDIQPWTITRPQDAQTGVEKPADTWAAPQTSNQTPAGANTQTPQPWTITQPQQTQPQQTQPSAKQPADAWAAPQTAGQSTAVANPQTPQPWTITQPQENQPGAEKQADAWTAPQTTGKAQTESAGQNDQPWIITQSQPEQPSSAPQSSASWQAPKPSQPGQESETAQKPADWTEIAKPEPPQPADSSAAWNKAQQPQTPSAGASNTEQTDAAWQGREVKPSSIAVEGAEPAPQTEPAPSEKSLELAAAPSMIKPSEIPQPLEAPVTAPVDELSEPQVVLEPDTGAPPPLPTDIDSVMSLAEEHLEAGRYKEASNTFKASLKMGLTPEELAQAYLGLAKVSLAFDNKQDSLNWLDRLLRQIPRSIRVGEALLMAAKIEFSLDRPADAATRLRQVLSNQSIFLSADQYRAASEELINALKRIGQDTEAFKVLVSLLQNSSPQLVESRLDEVFTMASGLGRQDVEPLVGQVQNPALANALTAALVKIRFKEGDISGSQELLAKLMDDPTATRWHQILGGYGEELKKARLVSPRSVGVILPLTGKYAQTGYRVRAAIWLSLGLFSSNDPNSLTVNIADSKSDPAVAAEAVTDLVRNRRVVAILGPMQASTSLAAAQRAQELGVPMISLSPVQGVTKSGNFVFQNFFSPVEQVEAVLDEHQANYGEISIAVLSPDNRYGQGFVGLLKHLMAQRGAKPVRVVFYDPKTQDMSRQIQQLAKLPKGNYKTGEKNAPKPVIDFKAVFIPDSPERIAMIAPLLAYWDVVGVDLLGTNLWHNSRLLSISSTYLEKSIFPDAFNPDSDDPFVASFVKEFRAAMGSNPNVLDAHGYDAASLLRTVITGANPPRTREAMRERLAQLKDIDGVCGKMTVSPSRRVKKNLTLLTVRQGSFVPFYRAQDMRNQSQIVDDNKARPKADNQVLPANSKPRPAPAASIAR